MEDGTWHNFEAIAKLEGTLAFLMGIKTLPIIVGDLISNGKCPDTPVAIIEKRSYLRSESNCWNFKNYCRYSKRKKNSSSCYYNNW